MPFIPDQLRHPEAVAFNRHRQRPYVHPEAEVEGEAEAEGWGKHRASHAAPLLIVFADDEFPTELMTSETPTDLPIKLQLVAWAKAVMVLDATEVLVRDIIERELAGRTSEFARLQPLKALEITNRAVAKVRTIRAEGFKTAFRLLRSRLGDDPILKVSLPRWAAYFMRQDAQTISATIQAGMADGLDSTEIARKVVGSIGLNGVDGVTEFTRHKVAHLGRAAIRESNLRKQGLNADSEAEVKTKGLDPGA